MLYLISLIIIKRMIKEYFILIIVLFLKKGFHLVYTATVLLFNYIKDAFTTDSMENPGFWGGGEQERPPGKFGGSRARIGYRGPWLGEDMGPSAATAWCPSAIRPHVLTSYANAHVLLL